MTNSYLYKEAIALLEKASSPAGIFASTENKDNYRRVWARDGMIAGIAGLVADNEVVIEGMRKAIIHLAKKQHTQGQIPSNIAFGLGDTITEVSYGKLVGRVDATTWWIIGTCIYLLRNEDEVLKNALYPNVEAAMDVLKSWEFNGRGLLYVPLSGNWADEYVTQGYTLYDQLLRLWGLKLAAKIWKRADWQEQAVALQVVIEQNYWIDAEKNTKVENLYHPIAYKKAEAKPYWLCSLAPNGYDTRFDLMANALAIQLGIGTATQKETLLSYIKDFAKSKNTFLLPVFYPIIHESDADWALLAENYAYQFKNYPHHFHNGGIWPVFLGWMAAALQIQDEEAIFKQMLNDLSEKMLNSQEPNAFYEYISSDSYQFGGTKQLCFSASGIVIPSSFTILKKKNVWKQLFCPA